MHSALSSTTAACVVNVHVSTKRSYFFSICAVFCFVFVHCFFLLNMFHCCHMTLFTSGIHGSVLMSVQRLMSERYEIIWDYV